ncbi:MAG: SOS response-associated peptidase [Bacteroidota bacterium]
MCGRFGFSVPKNLVEERFDISVDELYLPRYNCAPTQFLGVISNAEPGILSYFRWGLVPFWAKDISIGNKLINTRAETILEKPSFKSSFKRRRCLVPADGFYEWKKEKIKVPHRIMLRSGEPFAMAGIWDSWMDAAGNELRTFSIITTTPNELMTGIHNRMPVILAREAEKKWLEETDERALLELLKPYPAEEMKAYKISSAVNSPAHDSPEILNNF